MVKRKSLASKLGCSGAEIDSSYKSPPEARCAPLPAPQRYPLEKTLLCFAREGFGLELDMMADFLFLVRFGMDEL